MVTDNDIRIHERLTRLETTLAGHIDREGEQMDEVIDKLSAMEVELSRYRGFVGGILLMVTAVVTFLKFGLEYFTSK